MKKENHLGFMNPDNQVIRVSLAGDEMLEHAILENNFTRQFSGYRLISKDIGLIKEALNEFQNRKLSSDNIVDQSLTFFIIVTHGKCFAKADGRRISLGNSALTDCNQQEKELHHQIIELRHQYIAHGGHSSFEQNAVVMVKVPHPQGIGFRVHDNPLFMSSFKKELELYKSLIDKLTDYVERKLDKCFTAMMQDISEHVDWEEFNRYHFIPRNYTPQDLSALLDNKKNKNHSAEK